MIVWVYNRWGDQIGSLKYFEEMVHDDPVETVLDTVQLITPVISLPVGRDIIKGDRLVWKDVFGGWHESIVGKPNMTHAEGSIYYTVYAENSVRELDGGYIDERNSYNLSNAEAFARALEDTRWEPGQVDDFGEGDIKYYHESNYAALADYLALFGGELSTEIGVGPRGVERRVLNHVTARGADKGLMFEYGFDMDEVERDVDLADVYTRLHCFGKGVETFDENGQQTGYGRRLTFADINGGKDYVEDDIAMLQWGLPGKDGQIRHNETSEIWDDCEDAVTLLALGHARLAEISTPRVVYSASCAVLADVGYDFRQAATGDTVHLRDKPLNLRLSGRVMRVVRYYVGEGATQITLGNLYRNISEVFASQSRSISSLSSQTTNVNSVVSVDQSWLDHFVAKLNEAMNTGSSRFEGTEMGTIWCSVPLATDEAGSMLPHPATGGDFLAIRIKGGALDLSDSLTQGGDFEWRAFITGKGADGSEITGILRDSQSNTTWNLNVGTFATRNATLDDARHRGASAYIKNGTDTAAVVADNRGMTVWKGEYSASSTATTVKTGEKMLSFGVTAEDAPMFEVAGSMAVTNRTADKDDATGAAKTGSVPIGTGTVLHFVNGLLVKADEPASGGELY